MRPLHAAVVAPAARTHTRTLGAHACERIAAPVTCSRCRRRYTLTGSTSTGSRAAVRVCVQAIKEMLAEVRSAMAAGGDSASSARAHSTRPSARHAPAPHTPFAELPAAEVELRLLSLKSDVLQIWSDSF
jgi:hypothetical protein